MFVFNLLQFAIRGQPAPYLWIFYRALASLDRETCFLYTEEYRTAPSTYLSQGRMEVDDAFARSKDYPVPTDAEVDAAIGHCLPELIRSAVCERYSNNMRKLFRGYLVEVIPELTEWFSECLAAETRNGSPVEAVITWCNCPSLTAAATKLGIRVLHCEQGPLRSPDYIATAYFDFSGVNGRSDCARRYASVARDAWLDDYPPARLRAVLGSDNMISDASSHADRIGVALQIEADSNIIAFSNDEDSQSVVNFASSTFPDSEILVRSHPGSQFRYEGPLASHDPALPVKEFLAEVRHVVTISSSVAAEAALHELPVTCLGDCPHALFNDPAGTGDAHRKSAFYFLAYLVPAVLFLEPDYIRFRLLDPSEDLIVAVHLAALSEHAATDGSRQPSEMLRAQLRAQRLQAELAALQQDFQLATQSQASEVAALSVQLVAAERSREQSGCIADEATSCLSRIALLATELGRDVAVGLAKHEPAAPQALQDAEAREQTNPLPQPDPQLAIDKLAELDRLVRDLLACNESITTQVADARAAHTHSQLELREATATIAALEDQSAALSQQLLLEQQSHASALQDLETASQQLALAHAGEALLRDETLVLQTEIAALHVQVAEQDGKIQHGIATVAALGASGAASAAEATTLRATLRQVESRCLTATADSERLQRLASDVQAQLVRLESRAAEERQHAGEAEASHQKMIADLRLQVQNLQMARKQTAAENRQLSSQLELAASDLDRLQIDKQSTERATEGLRASISRLDGQLGCVESQLLAKLEEASRLSKLNAETERTNQKLSSQLVATQTALDAISAEHQRALERCDALHRDIGAGQQQAEAESRRLQRELLTATGSAGKLERKLLESQAEVDILRNQSRLRETMLIRQLATIETLELQRHHTLTKYHQIRHSAGIAFQIADAAARIAHHHADGFWPKFRARLPGAGRSPVQSVKSLDEQLKTARESIRDSNDESLPSPLAEGTPLLPGHRDR